MAANAVPSCSTAHRVPSRRTHRLNVSLRSPEGIMPPAWLPEVKPSMFARQSLSPDFRANFKRRAAKDIMEAAL